MINLVGVSMLSFVCSVAREKNPKITRMYMIYAITDIALTMIVMYLVINDVWLSFVAVDIDCLLPLNLEIVEIEGRWCLCVVLCEGLIRLPLNIYRLGIPEFAGGSTPPSPYISPGYRRIYAVVIFLACFLLFFITHNSAGYLEHIGRLSSRSRPEEIYICCFIGSSHFFSCGSDGLYAFAREES